MTAITLSEFEMLFVIQLIMPLLTFSCGLAFAGLHNWLAWTLVFSASSAIMALVFLPFMPSDLLHRHDGNLFVDLLACGLLPLHPVFLLWCARLLHARNPAP